jgi:hypothetical protein
MRRQSDACVRLQPGKDATLTSKTPIAVIGIDEKAYTPETCPPKHRNRGDDLCTDCGVELNSSIQDRATTSTAFRDHLSPTMQTELAFEYYEVRPCIERDRQISSYADERDYAADLKAAQASGKEFRTFWSLYGIDAGAHKHA